MTKFPHGWVFIARPGFNGTGIAVEEKKLIPCIHCKRSGYVVEHILVCDLWHNVVDSDDWCSRAEEKEGD